MNPELLDDLDREFHDRKVNDFRRYLIENPHMVNNVEQFLDLLDNAEDTDGAALSRADSVAHESASPKNCTQEKSSPASVAQPCVARPAGQAGGKQPAGKRPIVEWDEIPDVLSLPAPNVEWVLDGIIPRASITLIAGEPGSYKSWLALCLMRGCIRGAANYDDGVTRRTTDDAVLDSTDVTHRNTRNAGVTPTPGGTFLGRRCRSMDVLYLDRENPLSVVRERMAMLGITSLGVGDTPTPANSKNVVILSPPRRTEDPLDSPQIEPCATPPHPEARYWGGWLHDSAPGIGDFRLLQAARERHPLIIFDSLIRFHSADENSATEMAAAMQDLRALANAGATVILLHHRAKSETSRYRGSSDIAGGVDLAISVSRDRAAGIIKLDCFKSRFSEEFSMTLRPELHDRADFTIVETRDSTATPDVEPERPFAELVWEAIRTNPGLTKSGLLAASGLPKGRLHATLDEFDGKLWRSKRTLNNARQFYPTDHPVQSELDLEN